MKKLISYILFALTVILVILDFYYAIAGAIDVNNTFAELEARGAGGHEYLGVGLDVLVIGVIFISVVGFGISLVSWRIAQNRVIGIISSVLCPLFFLPIFVCAYILTS